MYSVCDRLWRLFLIDPSSAAASEVEYCSDNEATQEAVEVILDFVL